MRQKPKISRMMRTAVSTRLMTLMKTVPMRTTLKPKMTPMRTKAPTKRTAKTEYDKS